MSLKSINLEFRKRGRYFCGTFLALRSSLLTNSITEISTAQAPSTGPLDSKQPLRRKK